MKRDLMQRGFTLLEVMLVLGIISVLAGATIGGYSFATKQAQKARARELVSNTASALNAMFQRQSFWPPELLAGAKGDRQLTAEVASRLTDVMALSSTRIRKNDQWTYQLSGQDRCGIVDPWAQDVVKHAREGERPLDKAVRTGGTVKDHILYFALDEDGDGITEATVGGVSVRVRSNAIVWCAGMDGVEAPYPYSSGASGAKGKNSGRDKGREADDIYSWQPRQVVK